MFTCDIQVDGLVGAGSSWFSCGKVRCDSTRRSGTGEHTGKNKNKVISTSRCDGIVPSGCGTADGEHKGNETGGKKHRWKKEMS